MTLNLFSGPALLITVVTLVFLFFRYKKNNLFEAANPYSVFLSLSVFYILFPSLFTFFFAYSPVNATENIVIASAYAVYFHCIILFFALVSPGPDRTLFAMVKGGIKARQLENIVTVTGGMAVAAFVFIFVSNLGDISNLSHSRADLSKFTEVLNNEFKLKNIINYICVFVVLKIMLIRRLWPLIFLVPIVVLDIFLMGRIFMFQAAITALFCLAILKKNVSISTLISLALLIGSIAVLRKGFDSIDASQLVQIPLEFLLTFSNAHLVLASNEAANLGTSLLFSLFRIMPSFVYNNLFGEYVSVTAIAGNANPLDYGLAGHVVAEGLVFKNTAFSILFPFLVAFYLFFISWFLRRKTLSSFVVYILFLCYAQQIMRYSFLEFALYPFYFLIFLLPFIWFPEILSNLKRSKN
jgi:hypothetical protein